MIAKLCLALIGLIYSHVVFSQAVDEIKDQAFIVLDTKCNFCHTKDYPKQVFTSENMMESSRKIYKQVFVKEKMPKGDSVVLTKKERDVLLLWLKKEMDIDY